MPAPQPETSIAAAGSRKLRPWLPDFLIVGAMKCGTSSMRAALRLHPQIFMPDGEIFFFDIDDFQQHPDFFAYDGRRWTLRDFDGELERYLEWYARFFAQARPGQQVGEDSTTYLVSHQAPGRIARLNPDMRIIVMLRDPASRAYSSYWHLVRYGRAVFSFEDMLRLCPEAVVQRSYYKQQIEHYLRHLPRRNLHFVLLEEYVAAPAQVLDGVCRFLGVPAELLPAQTGARHDNRGAAPRWPRLQRLRNHLAWKRESTQFLAHLPDQGGGIRPGYRRSLADRLYTRLNPSVPATEPMRPGTREFLNRLFERENRGLDELVGKDLACHWYRD
jgi:hypothetical protein